MKRDLSIQEEQKTIYEKVAKKAVENIRKRGINACFVLNSKEALNVAMDLIPEGVTVGTADSTTLLQIGLFSALRKRGKNDIINPFIF